MANYTKFLPPEDDEPEGEDNNRDEDTLINRVRIMREEREAIMETIVDGLRSVNRSSELELSGMVLPECTARRVVYLPAIDIIKNLIDYGYPDDWLSEPRGTNPQDWVQYVIERDRNPAANKGIFDPESFYGSELWFYMQNETLLFSVIDELSIYFGIDFQAEYEQYLIARSYLMTRTDCTLN